MIAPHFLRQQLISLAIEKAMQAAPGTIINKIEVADEAVWIWTDEAKVTIRYVWNGSSELGGSSWSLFVDSVEDVSTTR